MPWCPALQLYCESCSSRLPVLAAGLVALIVVRPAKADEPPHGLEKRVPWASSRLAGSPEPPLPFAVEKTFAKQDWKSPIYIASEPSSDGLWIVQSNSKPDQGSLIVRIKDDPASNARDILLEIKRQLVYSVCFDPDYRNNGFVYVFTNGPRDAAERLNRVSRYKVSMQPFCIDPKSETKLIEWKSAGHDGGDMAFGLDGMFYITTGDGTSDSDGWDSGQTLNDLLGSVLRIDVRAKNGSLPYAIPRDNPFVSTPGARPEIWAYGLRNPWRMCTDVKTGHIWVGNNGQDLWETAYLLRRGANYGWSVYEGSHPFYLERKRGPTPVVPPTIEHSHAEFRSLTGGVVYYGKLFPELEGAYIYGDNSSGRIWGMKHNGARVLWHRELADTILQISAFQVDRRGELLVADYAGGINRLVRAPKEMRSEPFPTLLSQTGLFTSTSPYRLDPSLVPYSVNAPGWADGADASRAIAVPGDARVAFSSSSPWSFPDGTALVQTLSLDRHALGATRRFCVETRVLLRQQGEWAGYSYRWNSEQTDAALVGKNGEDTELDLGKPTENAAALRWNWRFPSRSECMACHSRAANFVLAVTGSQLNRDHDYNGVRDNQLRALDHIGFFTGALPKPPKDLERLVDPRDGMQDLELRVRTYLHVNCSVCHVEAGGGNSRMQLSLSTARDKLELIKARPQHDTFGITSAMLVAPGAPERSVLLHRLSERGRGQMPPLVSKHVDLAAVKLFRAWISGLKSDQVFVREWKMEDLLPSLDELGSGRSIESGRKAFRETGCLECHRAEGQGGSVGPDLTGIGRRLRATEMLESILLPSKVVAGEYATILVETASGAVLSGRIEREDDQVLVLRPPSTDQSVVISKNEIVARKRSDLSNMPPGIVNVLRKEQVLDLLAYLLVNKGPNDTVPP
jgi:uncharacterized repeat protein (TIGR03806 family)